MRILKYSWQVFPIFLAILGIIATYQVAPRKELQVILDSPISLVDVRPEAVQDIQVLYKKELVTKVYLLQVRIKNTGNQPIAESDYTRPLTFSFPQDYKLADAKVIASEPPSIGMTLAKTSEYTAQASPSLLNPDETVFARFIIIGADGDSILSKLSFDGRIVGIKEIKPSLSTQQQLPWWIPFLLGVITAAILNILGAHWTSKLTPERARDLGRRSRTWVENFLSRKQLHIQSATYGAGERTNDVTQLLRSKTIAGRLEIQVTNDNLVT